MLRLLTFGVDAIDDVDEEEEEPRSDVFCLFFGLFSTGEDAASLPAASAPLCSSMIDRGSSRRGS